MSFLIIWVISYHCFLIYSGGVGWGQWKRGWCNWGMVGLMRWKKRSQSLAEWWISQLCLLLSLISCYTRWFCTHCTKSLSRLWKKTVFSDKGWLTSENIWAKQIVSGHWWHREIRNWINERFLWSGWEVWNNRINGQIEGLFSRIKEKKRFMLKTETCQFNSFQFVWLDLSMFLFQSQILS